MSRLPQDCLAAGEVSVAEPDSTRPSAQAAKTPRGKHGAAVVLGALALAGGVTAAIDTAGSSTDVSVGRLAITLTAHDGFKLDTCTTNNSEFTGSGGTGSNSTTSSYQTDSITDYVPFDEHPLFEMVGVDTVPTLGFDAGYTTSFFGDTNTLAGNNQEIYIKNDGLAQVEMNGEIFTVKVESNGAVTLIDEEPVINDTNTQPENNQVYVVKNDGFAQVEMNGEIYRVKVEQNGEVTLIEEDN